MGREIVTIHVGQAGVQIGSALWELYCMEHDVSASGVINQEIDCYNRVETLFYETRDGRLIPRALFLDFEATVIDEIRSGSYKELFNPAFLMNGMEDAASNYARGFYNLGRLHIDSFMNTIRKIVNNCNNLSVFEIINSYPGGTGSGLTALLLEKLSEEFSKKFRFETGLFPSSTMSESTVGPYNSLLYTHSTFENLDCGILVDNESIYNKLCYQLNCQKPSFSMINRFLAQMLSCIFLSHRYNCQGSQHMDVDELMTNAVPYPRIHFPVLAYAPIVNRSQINHEITQPIDLIRGIFQTNSHFLNCPMHLTKYISCCLLFRGLISPKEVFEAVSAVKSDYRIQFVDWCPTGFKIGINNQPSLSTPNNVLAASNQTLCTLSGNIGIKESWRILRNKYQNLISKKAFIHWFVGEGLEENDLIEANEDIKVLERDYEEISLDTNSSNDVIIETIAANKYRNNQNTNNNLLSREKSLSPTKNILKLSHNNKDNCNNRSYSKMLYDDIVIRLDTKWNSSNKKMIKKLNKLQSRLNCMNDIYLDSSTSQKYLQKLPKKSLVYQRKTMNEEKEKLNRDNLIYIKRLLRNQTKNNLGFSSKEHIVCCPKNNIECFNQKCSEPTLELEDETDQRSLTTKVTSVPSVFI